MKNYYEEMILPNQLQELRLQISTPEFTLSLQQRIHQLECKDKKTLLRPIARETAGAVVTAHSVGRMCIEASELQECLASEWLNQLQYVDNNGNFCREATKIEKEADWNKWLVDEFPEKVWSYHQLKLLKQMILA